jgi:hypothetical protein
MVRWLASSDTPVSGLDHLGMRVASEAYYAALIDFATTVTYRPRYLSFYSWAWTRFLHDHGPTYDPKHLTRWIKTQEWWLLVASMMADKDASRLGGIEKARPIVSSAEAVVMPRLDFLKASEGMLGVYRGVMRTLRLLSVDKDNNEVPTEAARQLGAEFEAALQRSGFDAHLDAPHQRRQDLRRYGEHCGLTRLSTAHGTSERTRLVTLLTADRTNDRLAAPSESVAFLLRLVEALGEDDLPKIRRAIYEASALKASRGLDLAARYDHIIDAWTLYQVRDYILFALEGLLSAVILFVGRRRQTTLSGVLAEVADALTRTNERQAAFYDVNQPTAGAAMDKLTRTLWPTGPIYTQASRGPRYPDQGKPGAEATLADALQAAHGGHDPAALVRSAMDLLMVTLTRWRGLRDAPGSPRFEWPFEVESRRVPLPRLDRLVDDAVGLDPKSTACKVVEELVIQQHIETAFRKLLAQPRNDSARLRLAEGRLTTTSQGFAPAATSPRIRNALDFAKDLGLIDTSIKPPSLTAAGIALCTQVESGT